VHGSERAWDERGQPQAVTNGLELPLLATPKGYGRSVALQVAAITMRMHGADGDKKASRSALDLRV